MTRQYGQMFENPFSRKKIEQRNKKTTTVKLSAVQHSSMCLNSAQSPGLQVGS